MRRLKVLILGGSGESSALSDLIADDPRFDATLSIAGRTRSPRIPRIGFRSGGFGGVDGLAEYLRGNAVDVVVDATHPFAEQMSAHARRAAERLGLPLLRVDRPAWNAAPGDAWTEVPDLEAAADALGAAPRRVFLTTGQKELRPFAARPQHWYLIRSVEPPPTAALPPQAEILTARGPFAEPDERRLMAEHRIAVLVTKNSGGTAAAAKLDAARALGIPVILVARPPADAGPDMVADAPAAAAWLRAHHDAWAATERGV